MSSVYKLYSGDTKFYNIQLWVAKRIANEAITAVAQSPISYKVKDAYSVVTTMADDIDKYTNATELLEALGSGKITHKELGDVLTAKVTEHISKIKNAFICFCCLMFMN